MSNIYNPKIDDVPSAFNMIGKNGEKKYISGLPLGLEVIQSHIQGISSSKEYIILSHNNHKSEKGIICVVNDNSKEMVYYFDTPAEGFNHPGGMQTIGDYLVVPIEMADETPKSCIYFLDMSRMTDTVQPSFLPFYIERNSGKAGAVGITNFTADDGTEKYILLVYDNGKIDVYLSGSGASIMMPDFKDILFSTKMTQSDYSSICLLTDVNNNIYVVGFRTKDMGLNNEDHADLFKIDLTSQTISSCIQDRHMVTSHGGISVGALGVHFRYGAGIRIISNEQLQIYATQRNILLGECTINIFS